MEEHNSDFSEDSDDGDNSDEISWVSYGLMASVTMVAYQFFLVYFMNAPSTIIVKITVSLVLGILLFTLESSLKLISYFKYRNAPKNRHRFLSHESATREYDELCIEEENSSNEDTQGYKNSLCRCISSFFKKFNNERYSQGNDCNYSKRKVSYSKSNPSQYEEEKQSRLHQALIKKDNDTSNPYQGVGSCFRALKGSRQNFSNRCSYFASEKNDDSEEASGFRKSKKESFMKSDTDKSLYVHQRILEKIQEQEQQLSEFEEDDDTRTFECFQTCNLAIGAILFSLSHYGFLYCFESRRYYSSSSSRLPDKDLNHTWMYGQTLVMIIVPLIFLMVWKIYKCDKPVWVRMATTLIPFLIILSLVLTSWKIYYELHFFAVYCFEITASIIFAISLTIIKYTQKWKDLEREDSSFTQKSYMQTLRAIIYSELGLSIAFLGLKYIDWYPRIYSEKVFYRSLVWYESLFNPFILLVGGFYLLSIFLLSHMMSQTKEKGSYSIWTPSKIRVSTLLCMKAFESEALILISLFNHSEELDILDMLGMFIFMIALLIMSCDDTSTILMQTIFAQEKPNFETFISERLQLQHPTIERNFEYFVVETDESMLVKHREAVSKHYKEASIQRFSLKFYGINIPNEGVEPNDEKDLIRKGLNEYIERLM
ncbi:unnamed protein product [Moneuplotes crassus]|uniref:Uncharacterized protein n=1 Tax=Euplotes crassus TaxID=5936 RepID=A0AAD1U3P3_EUPCR|nr:unnamed protein product [Moneuplotes crassus]